MVWLLAVFLIPVVVAVLLFFSAAEDFWQIVTFRIDLSRLFGDLVHVLAIMGIGVLAEIFSIFMLVRNFL
ncbi:hypothetical protein HFQ13_10530 [Acidithiobacillus sp. VAN18-1]|uniref:Uncharacterized protein n=1 Tax=Igneacidithiobacillus copahuensis TaxID=2724909 RepID=A0AAE2YQX1_9PROT|nr:hypothetical protein [Igneacidithiobacillus copahuensis]MBU2788626.1 hypothetical protein [Igneacidithiobacillus copahuensis]MBU2796690.1 hypothetical protein [Acidithiobacillus sp. VAN18-2]